MHRIHGEADAAERYFAILPRVTWLPHFGAICNLLVTVLIIWAFIAIRGGDRVLHPKLMKGAIGVGLVFLISYLVQIQTIGHGKGPESGWLRPVFLVILATHTAAAIAVLPLVVRSAYLGMRKRFEEHRRIVRFAYPIWLYVGVTGVVIYLIMYHRISFA